MYYVYARPAVSCVGSSSPGKYVSRGKLKYVSLSFSVCLSRISSLFTGTLVAYV